MYTPGKQYFHHYYTRVIAENRWSKYSHRIQHNYIQLVFLLLEYYFLLLQCTKYELRLILVNLLHNGRYSWAIIFIYNLDSDHLVIEIQLILISGKKSCCVGWNFSLKCMYINWIHHTKSESNFLQLGFEYKITFWVCVL